MILTRDGILSADDLPKELVSVPEWGGEVYVRRLTAAELDAFEQSTFGGKKLNLDNVRARFCVRCICDQSGTRLFSDADAEALGCKSAAALDRCHKVALHLNRRTQADMEELEKNSGSGLSAASTSA